MAALTERDAQHNIELLLRGIYPSEYPGSVVYKPWQIVDVRDCAAGHVGLLESVKVKNGERYIAWSTEMYTLEDISHRIAALLPELGYTPPAPTLDPPLAIPTPRNCSWGLL